MFRKINWINVIEQSIGAIIASATIAIAVYIYNVIIGKAVITSWLWIGGIILIISIVATFLWKTFREYMNAIGHWVLHKWQIIICVIVTGLVSYLAYQVTQLLVAPILVFSLSFIIWLLAKSHYSPSQRIESISKNPYKSNVIEVSKNVASTSDQKYIEWRREDIQEWTQPLLNFKTIPFGNSLVNSITYPEVRVPFKKPLFGNEKIPFELYLKEQHELIKGIEHRPRTFNDLERSAEIRPGAKRVVSAYVLLSAGSAHRIVDNVEFDRMRIGCLEFYFEEGDKFQIDLILGHNVRDWSYKHPDVVQSVVDVNVEQVWRDSKDEVTIDMLRIDIPNPPRNISYCQFYAQYQGVPEYYRSIFPSIRLSGLTYRVR